MIQNVMMTLLLLPTAVQDSPASAGTELVETQARPDLVPGVLPANAAPDAAQAWKALCAAVGAGKTGERLRAFDLTFEGTAYSGEAQSNDFDIERFLYLDPGWVRMTLKSGRVRLRGPAGDFLLDTKRGSQVPLRGRELAADIRELNETVRIARSFVALTDPGNLRMSALGLTQTPPGLPANLADFAAKLVWLDLLSPDFHPAPPASPETAPSSAPGSTPGTATTPEALFRVRIGCDPGTHLPRLAVIQEATEGQARIETAMLLQFRKFRQLDGYQIPGRVRTFMPDTSVSPWVFDERTGMELWLLEGSTLAPQLSEQDFRP